ncbi:MAG: asparagine synthase-related protein [Ilumatobacteraceae bacterium]
MVVSDRLTELLLLVGAPVALNRAAIGGFLALDVEPTDTPFEGIHRIPPGHRATWTSGVAAPRITPHPVDADGDCSGAGLLGADVPARAIELFDRAIDRGVARSGGGPLCAAMSGGLDSTFAVASLARHASSERPVQAFVHVPHPDARLTPIGNWDPEDLEPARSMESATGGRVAVVPIANLDLVQPLDVAARIGEQTWAPVFNPANAVWIDMMRARAHDLGARALFHGEYGNVVYSSSHPYALRHHLARGQFALARDVWRGYRSEGLAVPEIARRFVVGPYVRTLQARWADLVDRSPQTLSPLGPLPRGRPFDRRTFEAWIERNDRPLGTMPPQTGRADLFDPFADAGVVAFARAMVPGEWERHGSDRGFARHLGIGRVPDDVRLRTRRGGQSWDHWFVIRHQRERYLDEVRSIPATPIVSDLVDGVVLGQIEAEVSSWPWGEPGPAPRTLLRIERWLALAAFVRSTSERLARLEQSGRVN